MIFADLPNGASVFVDADILVYHFQPHPQFGPACTDFLERIELQDLIGLTSTHILAEVCHRLKASQPERTRALYKPLPDLVAS